MKLTTFDSSQNPVGWKSYIHLDFHSGEITLGLFERYIILNW